MKLREYSKKWVGVRVPFYLMPQSYKNTPKQGEP